MSIKDRIKDQRYRVSMNVKHLCVRSGDEQLVQLNDGTYGKLPVRQITFSREGENNNSPWTRWYDLSNPQDAEDIEALRELIAKHPNIQDDIELRVRIVGEFEGVGEPWPGYDDMDSEQLVAYYNACPEKHRPTLESMMQYELNREAPDESKVVAIETLDKDKDATARKNATAGVKL